MRNHQCLSILCAALSTACSATSPTDAAPAALAAVSIDADSLTTAVHEQVRLTAIAKMTNGAAAPDLSISWRATGAAVTVDQDGGVEGVSVGESFVVATAQHSTGARSDSIRVRVLPALVASITIEPRELTLGAGGTYPLNVLLKDKKGRITTAPVLYQKTEGVVAVHDATLHALKAGKATITIVAGSAIASLPVHVLDDFPFTINSVRLTPLTTITVEGAGVGSATVRVGEVNAQRTSSEATRATFTVPPSPFAPCWPAGRSISLEVSTATTTRRMEFETHPIPISLSLGAGEHAVIEEMLALGCDVSVAAAGEYLVMPFAWDRATSESYAPAGPVSLQLRVLSSNASVLAAQQSAFGMGMPLPKPAASPSSGMRFDSYRSDHVWDLARAGLDRSPPIVRTSADLESVGSCPIPLTPGATITIGTERDALGQVSVVLRGSPTETWTLAAISPHLAVFFDSTMVRLANGDADIAGRLTRFVAAYDSTVVPLMAQFTAGVPDGDGNGRVVMLLPHGNAFAYALPNGYGRPDCTFGAEGGEAFLMRSRHLLIAPIINLPTALASAAHETAHLVDHKQPQGSRQGSAWSGEGFAMQFNWLWSAGEHAQMAYGANRATAWTRVVENAGTGYSCVDPQRSSWVSVPRFASGAGSYTFACAMVRAIVVRGIASGLSPRDALMKFVALRRRYSFAEAWNEYEGTTRPAAEVVGEWLMMWYADDQVSGTSPALQDPAMRWRSAWTFSPWPLPDQTLSPGDAITLMLEEPDVRHFIATLPSNASIRLGSTLGTPIVRGRAALGILRIR